MIAAIRGALYYLLFSAAPYIFLPAKDLLQNDLYDLYSHKVLPATIKVYAGRVKVYLLYKNVLPGSDKDLLLHCKD